MKSVRKAMIVAMLLGGAGCSNEPDANFEQALKDRSAADAGDPYTALESSLPRVSRYVAQKTEIRRDYAVGQSGTYRATYDGLLPLLEKDKEVDATSPTFKACRSAYAQASQFQTGEEAPMSDVVLAALRACRADAQKLKEVGGDKEDDGALLSRFASAGVVIVGAKMVAQGDVEAGSRIWREGEELVSKDKPGFELGVKSFRGY